MTDKEKLLELLKTMKYAPFPGMKPEIGVANQFSEYALNHIVDELLNNGVIISEPRTTVNEKRFNPFYDSDFLISHEGSDEHRMLMELYEDELIQLRSVIDAVLAHLGASAGIANGA